VVSGLWSVVGWRDSVVQSVLAGRASYRVVDQRLVTSSLQSEMEEDFIMFLVLG